MDHGNESLLDIDFVKLSEDTRQSQKGLPAAFILSTCKRIFQKEYEDVEFGQALTALDYLRDLEITRRATLRSAAARLRITRDTWKAVLAENADALKWVELVQKYELMIEEGYAAIFVDIRIWVSQAVSWKLNDKANHARRWSLNLSLYHSTSPTCSRCSTPYFLQVYKNYPTIEFFRRSCTNTGVLSTDI